MSQGALIDYSSLQPSDTGATDIGIQDYSQIDNSGLAAPSLDSPLGTDPLSGANLPLPGVPASDPFAPPLTVLAPDASGGLNAYNDQLLPLSPASTVDTSVYTGGPTLSTGSTLGTLDGNLPLAPVGTASVKLGSATAQPNPNPAPLGASLWSSMVGAVTSVLGGSKTGTVAGPVPPGTTPGTIKPAPKTAISNPISGMSTALIIGVVASLIGIVIWSFAGSK